MKLRLQERLPDGVWVDGKYYRCDFDFRNVLKLIDVLDRNDLMEEAYEYNALKCVMKRLPRKRVRRKVINAIKELLLRDQKKQKQNQADNKNNIKKNKRVTDFDQDAGMIRAAFRQAYGIDLYRDSLHWIEFSELLNAIPEGSRYSEVVGIRVRDVPNPTKYNQAERTWLINAKARVALEVPEEEQQQQYEEQVKGVFGGLLAWAQSFDKPKGSDSPDPDSTNKGSE